MTKHFTLTEFTRSDTATKLGIKNAPDEGVILKLNYLATYLLEPLREKFGTMVINSGYRCKELNKAVGGVSNSRHMTGNAADVVFTKSSMDSVLKYLQSNQDNLKWRQVIFYKTRGFVHFDFDKTDVKQEILFK